MSFCGIWCNYILRITFRKSRHHTINTQALLINNNKALQCNTLQGLCPGGEEEDRTPDLCIANAALSQLSYFPIPANRRRRIICFSVRFDKPDG